MPLMLWKKNLSLIHFHRRKIDEIEMLLTIFTHAVFLEDNRRIQDLGWFVCPMTTATSTSIGDRSFISMADEDCKADSG